jgi:hypothetical protein
LTETSTNVGKDGGLGGVRLVENVLERRVGRAEAVEEVLGEDPSRVGVGGLLDGELGSSVEEGVVGKDVCSGRESAAVLQPRNRETYR